MLKTILSILLVSFIVPAPATEFTMDTAQPFKLIVPYIPGGGPDAVFRVLQKHALKKGINFIPDYKPGANGLIGAEYAAKYADPDKTLMLSVVADLTQKSPVKKINYTDFHPVSAVCNTHSYLVANINFPANNLSQLIKMLQANPQAASIIASTQSQEEILKRTFSYYSIVPEEMTMLTMNFPKGSAAVMGNHVDIGLWPANMLRPIMDSGRLKILASYKRNDLLDQGKNLEVMSEVSKFNRLDGYGIFLPKTTSPAAVKYWTTFFNDLKQDKALVSDYNNMDCVLFKEPGNQELLDIIKSNETFTPVIKKEKISLTVRQEQIADLIIKRGYSNQKIAQVLNISESTVKFHAGIVYKKYGVQTRTQLIASS